MNSVIISRLLRTLNAVKVRVEELCDAIQEHSRTIRSAGESEDRKKWPAEALKAVIAYDDNTASDAKAEQNRQYRVQNSIRWAAWSAFAAATIYSGVAALQLYQMRKATQAAVKSAYEAQQANRDARDRFREEERPYVWLTSNGLGAPEFIPAASNPSSPSGQVIWTWHYTNYGKTPAFNIRWHQYMSIDGKPFVQSYGAPPRGDVGSPLPPTQDVFTTVVSRPGYTREQVARALAVGGKGISISVRMDYTDGAGGKYETEICLRRLNTGAISYCTTGNYIR